MILRDIIRQISILVRFLAQLVIDSFGCVIVLIAVYLERRRHVLGKKSRTKPALVWGPVPLINNKYWSRAMKGAGYESVTLMDGVYQIYDPADFDVYTSDLFGKRWWSKSARLRPYLVFAYAVKRFDIFHHHYSGGYLSVTKLARFEAQLLRLARKKIVITPYGSDAYKYSLITDLTIRHALLMSYPQLAREERRIGQALEYWNQQADAIIPGCMTFGISRWDVLVVSHLTIDTAEWKPKTHFSEADGKCGTVRVFHTPNHRGFKGTEFILRAVSELREEGLAVELVLAENVKNSDVKMMMKSVDILAEQLLHPGYAMSAIEGMASGLPVISNLEDCEITKLWRRFSYLDECPIQSATPESVKSVLRRLIQDPKLRERLAMAGREYVEKYHSESSAAFMFGRVYEKIWYGRDVQLLDMYNPMRRQRDTASSAEHVVKAPEVYG